MEKTKNILTNPKKKEKKALNELREKIPADVWAEKWEKRRMEKIEKKIKDILDKQCCWCGDVSHKDRELTPGQTRTAIMALVEEEKKELLEACKKSSSLTRAN